MKDATVESTENIEYSSKNLIGYGLLVTIILMLIYFLFLCKNKVKIAKKNN